MVPGSAVRWSMAHYTWMLSAATMIVYAPRPARLPVALAATMVGVGLDRALGSSTAAPWFAPIYSTKLLVGHAAGSAWNRHPIVGSSVAPVSR